MSLTAWQKLNVKLRMKGKFARASVPTFVLKENKDEFGKVKLLKKRQFIKSICISITLLILI